MARPDTVLYLKQNTIHDTEPVSLSASSSRYFCIASNIGQRVEMTMNAPKFTCQKVPFSGGSLSICDRSFVTFFLNLANIRA